MRKFNLGDRVRIVSAPMEVGLARGRPRTIIAIHPGRVGRVAYILHGFPSYHFASYELERYEPRRYHRHMP